MQLVSLEERKPVIAALGFVPERLPLLQDYIDQLWRANAELNLVSRKMTPSELVDNHVIDCLLPLAMFPGDVKVVADFGSGGGMPGVIYALQFPHVQFRLYEKSPLKREFLSSCVALAPNLEVHGEIPLDFTDVDLVTARAFKPIDVILDVSRKYHARGGRYFLLKGRREKIDEELELARKKFKDLKVDIQALKSPVLEVTRHLVRI